MHIKAIIVMEYSLNIHKYILLSLESKYNLCVKLITVLKEVNDFKYSTWAHGSTQLNRTWKWGRHLHGGPWMAWPVCGTPISPAKSSSASSTQRSSLFSYMEVNAGPWNQPYRSPLTDATPECCVQYWTSAKQHMLPTSLCTRDYQGWATK